MSNNQDFYFTTMSFTYRRIISYFLRGLLFVIPLAVTLYIIYQTILFLDNLIPVPLPGIGILMVLALITFVGYLASLFFAQPIFDWFERGLVKIPLVNIIYTSIKDLMGAFVGDKKKFSSPVKVQLSDTLIRLGFITQDDMSVVGEADMVAVYFPHSYNVSGNVFLVPRDKVTPLVGVKSSDVMKFMVSGGVSPLV
ncbi:putative membrane protein [Algoriphagus antarcticus]|uniref:Putative membrane protein n=2 Tax=Algoriphagus antarcticus TaxID=238540 RepID=A0A3E0DP91_9BACT|nr:putative membrane protein [Algoriphagus antarcticus]